MFPPICPIYLPFFYRLYMSQIRRQSQAYRDQQFQPHLSGKKKYFKGVPVNVDESCVHGTHPSDSLEGKAAVLMNYSHFRKLGLDPHQDEIVLAGVGLLDRVHRQIHRSWLIDSVDALGPER